MPHYDLIVIGSGPAGAKGAEQAARLGKSVALIERAPRLGGAGINTGTVPSKTLRETAQYLAGLRQRSFYGLNYHLQPDLTLGDLMFRKQMVLESEWGVIQRNLDRHRIHIVRGAAHLHDGRTVHVNYHDGRNETLTAEAMLVATGSSAYHPPHIPFDHPRVFDSASLPDMGALPRHMIVIGGGVIGMEYAAMFAALGARVTLIEIQPRLLPVVDHELAERLRRSLEEQGMRFVLNEQVVGVDVKGETLYFKLQSGEAIACDSALIAAGRRGYTAGFGLERAGVALDAHDFVKVNAHMQTNVPNIYAAGDVTGHHSFAPTSMEQGRAAVLHAFQAGDTVVKPIIPLAVYTIPEIAMIGLTEEQCKAQGHPYMVGRGYADQNPRGQIIGDTSGVLKLIFSPADKALLGVHILGENASELIHLGLHVMMTGGTLDVFTQMVYSYPSLSDLYTQAAYNGLEHWERWRQWQSQQISSL